MDENLALALEVELGKKLTEELLAAIAFLHFDGYLKSLDAADVDCQASNDGVVDAAADGDVADDDGYSAAAGVVDALADLHGGRAGYGV